MLETKANLYPQIFRRKSFRRYKELLALDYDDLMAVEEELSNLQPLFDDIAVETRIELRESTQALQGEYSLVFFSEERQGQAHAMNAGYMLEQFDLFCASRGIGCCWNGIPKWTGPVPDGMRYIIMMTFGRDAKGEFRTPQKTGRRKPLEEFWHGPDLSGCGADARLSPSACNLQPWYVEEVGNVLYIYRRSDIESKLIGPELRPFYNTMDLGVFMCILELSLAHRGVEFERSFSFEAPESIHYPAVKYTLNR